MTFKPCYTWPNPAFHFRLYFNHERCRIFIIENIAHNWEWLHQYKDRIRDTDYFLVQLGWYFDDWLADESRRAIEALGLDITKFIILFSDYASKQTFESLGFSGRIVNYTCFLDYDKFKIIDVPKKYDAIYTARFVPFKRHYLCSEIDNLALVAGDAWGDEIRDIPKHSYLNEKPLTADEVVVKVNESKCGLILSEFEGACYASSEYLLCGVPVVSTWSHGGRDIWYNSYNSIICDADPAKISSAVKALGSKNRDPTRIRAVHINLSNQMREEFNDIINDITSSHCLMLDSSEYFKKNYFHKMINSQTPDFEQLFSEAH
jgi:glycosyltransferase involved in cell wall biosynthesis